MCVPNVCPYVCPYVRRVGSLSTNIAVKLGALGTIRTCDTRVVLRPFADQMRTRIARQVQLRRCA